ncbi:MAG: putative metal-binding motif-containing protein, partial [Candidatus Falkowbacteria bacterium]|nr:putative metal-binding motif-containing protein [Candidatus Falkowbacteria bacterium]
MNKQFFSNNYKKVCVLGLTAIFITGLISGLFVSTETVFADSNGPRNAGTGTDMSDIGTISWSHPDRIIADDTNYATADVPEDGKITHYLKGTNYGFSIPSGATIDGIEVAINRQSSGQSSPFLRDNVVKLVKAGTVTGDNKAVTGTNWPTFSLETATYGDSSDKWGTTWTSTDINNVNFGVVLSAKNSNTGHNRTATVDYIQITVYYTPACTPTTWYHDGDADGFGDASGSTSSCTQPTGYVSNSTDCDDTNSAVNPGATEVCDGIDNDCDLTIDEGALWTNKGQACSVGQGICQASGTYICDAGHPAGPTICSATPGSSSPETCNGLDDDCDGQVDEGNPGGGSSCNTGLQGVCATGNLTCTGGALTCIQNVQSSTEVCDGLDNNCDGQVDEGGVCSITINASKIICDDEADLPNWGTGSGVDYPDTVIGPSTAIAYVREHPNCHLVPGWSFQWGQQGSGDFGRDFYGEAGNGYTTFGPTDANGVTTATVTSVTGSYLELREVLQQGFIPFTYDQSNQSNDNNVSAEFYCHDDILNYDNWDYINGAQLNH